MVSIVLLGLVLLSDHKIFFPLKSSIKTTSITPVRNRLGENPKLLIFYVRGHINPSHCDPDCFVYIWEGSWK